MIRVTLNTGATITVRTLDTATVDGVPCAILDGGEPIPWSSIASVEIV